jgi:hypothetical protein
MREEGCLSGKKKKFQTFFGAFLDNSKGELGLRMVIALGTHYVPCQQITNSTSPTWREIKSRSERRGKQLYTHSLQFRIGL